MKTMNRGRRVMAASMLAFGLAACGGGSGAQSTPSPVTPPAAGTTVRADFSATNAEYPNPERGFYRAASGNLDGLSAAQVADAYAAGFRLMYTRIDLEAYREADIPDDYLNRLEVAFATARAGGVKLIVRATYNYPRGETEYRDAKDASLERVLSHLNQLKPVFARNADVISVMQAGFIGAWGEWHTSSNNLTTPENRTRIKDALLDAVPSTRFVQFRYPPYIQDWTPTLPSLEAALTGSYRIGFHNDCFMASSTDVGTYDENATVRAGQQQYTGALGDLAPFGGETCNPADEANPTPRTTCAEILSEGAHYNLTYLNDSYYRPLFHNNWISNGCMAQVQRSMGYRFGLVSLTHPASATKGGAIAVSGVVRNSGWARLYNPRPVEIVLRHSASGTVRRFEAIGVDPRRWLPGADATIAATLTVPTDLAAGVYQVWLALPDADGRLKSDVRYSIRLANADDAAKGQKWDSTLGAFATGTKVEVR